jgi:hypothetical protein
MAPDANCNRKPHPSRSSSARVALWNRLIQSPANAGGLYDRLTQAEFDSFIEAVPPRWTPYYEEAFKIARGFEDDGKPGRLYLLLACATVQQFERLEGVMDGACPSLDGLFALLREHVPPEVTGASADLPSQTESPICRQLHDTVMTILKDHALLYELGIVRSMQQRFPLRQRKPIPKEAIKQLAKKRDKLPFKHKTQLVQSVADKYGVSTRTVYRKLDALNSKS